MKVHPIFLAFVFLLLAHPVNGQEKMVFVTIEHAMASIPSEVVVREAYRRLGIDIEIKKLPARRALLMSNGGEVDGEVQRIGGVSKRYPNLIQVYPPINVVEGVVFSNDVNFSVAGWESLRKYRIGIVRGVQFVTTRTEGMNTEVANNYNLVFKILEGRRVDIIAVPRLNGLVAMKRQRLKHINMLEPAIEQFPIYHYLHEKNRALVPQISAVFKEMTEDGSIDRIKEHVVAVLLERSEKGLPICDDDYSCFEE